MDARRKLGWAFLLAGILAGVAMLWLNPLPAEYEQWATSNGAGSALMVARGPAVARYDAATDTTVALFWCAHGYCPVATQIAGNVTAQVGRAQTMLYSPRGAPVDGQVDLATPLPYPESSAPGGNVTTMTATRFEVGRTYLPLLLYQLAFLAILAGALLVVAESTESHWFGLLGGAVGLVLGTQLVARGDGLVVVYVLALVLTLGAGSGLVLAGRWRPRLAPYGAGLLGLFAALLFSGVVASQFFALPPTV